MTTNFEIGQAVCAAGRGADAIAHWHGKVTRLTKTMIIVTSQRGNEHRFSRTGIAAHSIPYAEYGGLTLSPTCQKKEKS